MKRLFFPLVLIVVLAFLAVVLATNARRPAYDPTEWAWQEAEAQRIERAAQLDAFWQPIRAAAVNIVGIVLLILVPVCIAAFGGVALARFRRYARPDARGVLPVSRDNQQAAIAALASFHQVEQTRAAVQPTPHAITSTYHYAPHYRADSRGVAEHTPEQLPGAVAAPTFAQMLDSGRIGPNNPLVLGHDLDTGAEISGSWLDLYSTIVSGLPGSGKTTAQRFLGAQTALQGARFVIVDPHAGAAEDSLAATLEPLRSVFLCEPASSDKAILDAVRLVADIGQRRITGTDSDTTPIILWLDETTALLARSAVAGPLAELIEQIAQEYRKKRVFVSASGQIWSADRTGDSSALRDSFASVLCHRMKRSQARLLLPTEEAATVERLGVGQAVLWRTSGSTCRLGVPNTTAADVQAVAQRLANPRHTLRPESSRNVAADMPADMSSGSQQVARPNLATSASGSPRVASAEAMRAAALFLAGNDMAQVVATLRGIKSNEGKRYQLALAEVQQLVREGLQPSC